MAEAAPSQSEARRESLWGGPKAAFAAILAGAAALRLVGIQYGLPYGNLLNPDEQSIVPRSWSIVHGGGLDPHWFDYPSLLIYALAPTQVGQDEPSYLAARIGVAVLAVATVAATWWLAQRVYGSALAGGVAAAIVAVETTHVAYGHMAVTDVPLTLGVAVALALMIRGPLELAGIAVGIATGFKYPGVFLLAPLVVAGWGRWRRLAGAVALSVVAFLASSPFIAAHPGEAWSDFWRVSRAARTGWLGFEHDHWAGIAFVAHLWHGLGPVLVIAVAGLVAALVRRSRADLVLAAFVLVYFLDLLTLHAHFDRYVLPLVPPLAVLAARFRAIASVTLVLLVVPLAFAVRDDSRLTRTDTRIVAERWLAEHAAPERHGCRRPVDAQARRPEGHRAPAPRPGPPVRSASRRRGAAAPRRAIRLRHGSRDRSRAPRGRPLPARGRVLPRAGARREGRVRAHRGQPLLRPVGRDLRSARVTGGAYSIPEVQRLLSVLAAGRHCAEIGTAFGIGAAAIASTAASLVTVEIDPERVAKARKALAGFANVDVLEGDWRDELPPRAPFELLFLDGGDAKDDPRVVDLAVVGGLFVLDDFTAGRKDLDARRELWLGGALPVVATEVMTTPEMSAILATRVR